ncbi:hypothetical protein BDQ17DRAFT_1406956 [Cyathus striatus]|nr:hypothetical protein BDQ17DRAFT_1406956 [Cyathus striatus]
MASRSSKKSNDPSLSNLESLILAQAVYEVGASPATWPHIASLLSKHPLLDRPKSFFTPQSCHLMYDDLLKSAGLHFTDKNASPHAPVNTQLAQKYYTLRFNELRELIAGEEAKFKSIMAEIQDIRSGACDNQLKEKMSDQLHVDQIAVAEVKDVDESQTKQNGEAQTSVGQTKVANIEEEVFDGSDLSGVTDSTSPSQPDDLEKRPAELSPPGSTTKDAPSSPGTSSPKAGSQEPAANPSEEIVFHHVDMDIADDERAEENELADQLVPDQISSIISSPTEDEAIDVDSSAQLLEMVSVRVSDEGHNDTLEAVIQTAERDEMNALQHIGVFVEESDHDSEQKQQKHEGFEREDMRQIQLARTTLEENRQSSVVNSGDNQTNEEGHIPEDDTTIPEQDIEGITENETETEELNEPHSKDIDMGTENVRQDEDLQGTDEVTETEQRNEPGSEDIDMSTGNEGGQEEDLQGTDEVEAAEPVLEARESTQHLKEQQMEQQVNDPTASSEENTTIVDEDLEIQQVGITRTNLEQESDDVPLGGDGEDEDVGLRSEVVLEPINDGNSAQEALPLEQSTQQSTERHEQELVSSIQYKDTDLEDDKYGGLEAATPLDAEPIEEELQSGGKSVIKDEHSSDEGPSPAPRRSTRRRKSSATSTHPSAPTRGRPRRQSQLALEQESSPAIELDPEPDSGVDEDKEARPSSTIVDIAMSKHQGKRKAAFMEGLEITRERKRARDESEPVKKRKLGLDQARLVDVHRVKLPISQHRNGNIFHNPIKNTEAPDYHDIVKRPMDLKTIKAKVKDGLIANSLEYQRDIYLMFANAMMYNRPESDVHSMAEDMMLESEGYIRTFRQTEGLVRGNRG